MNQAFRSQDELRAHLGRFIIESIASPGYQAALAKPDLTLKVELTDPEDSVIMRLRSGTMSRVDLGPTTVVADTILSMSATSAHLMVLGELNLAFELDSGTVIASGSVDSLLGLMSCLRTKLSPLYAMQLSLAGRDDLIPRGCGASAAAGVHLMGSDSSEAAYPQPITQNP